MYKNILVALDGSEASNFAGRAAIKFACAYDSYITACHVYGIDIHKRRFTDMEPGLPKEYQKQDKLLYLRSTHDKLMLEGFQSLSVGYVEDFIAFCKKNNIPTQSAAIEGRSYTGILQLATTLKADLVILGANGIGEIGDGLLGGTTSRVLYNIPCDLLVCRRDFDRGSILTGVDGSKYALDAVGKAISIGSKMSKALHISAVYDPVFHVRVFDTVASTFSTERQEEVGLAEQEKLHNDIINEGLEKLYTDFLDQAKEHFNVDEVSVTTSLATGKAYHALNNQVDNSDVDLVVLSRHGNHRQPNSIIGSNTENLLRTTKANVLIVGGVEKNSDVTAIKNEEFTDQINDINEIEQAPVWEPEAQARLKRVPFFARGMAKRTVEKEIKKSGKKTVSAEDFNNIAAQFGMGKK